jgi:hypothetical protein
LGTRPTFRGKKGPVAFEPLSVLNLKVATAQSGLSDVMAEPCSRLSRCDEMVRLTLQTKAKL